MEIRAADRVTENGPRYSSIRNRFRYRDCFDLSTELLNFTLDGATHLIDKEALLQPAGLRDVVAYIGKRVGLTQAGFGSELVTRSTRN